MREDNAAQVGRTDSDRDTVKAKGMYADDVWPYAKSWAWPLSTI